MAVFFNLLAIGSIVAAMVLAFLHLTRGKRTLPFADDSHARTFGWGLLLPLLLMLGYAFREEPMANGSLWLLVVMMVASAGWFYLAGNYRYSLRRWDMPLWQGVACAQLCGLIIVTMGSVFALSAEDNARNAYMQKHEPQRYAAIQAEKVAKAQQAKKREAAREARQKEREVAEAKMKWEEKYKNACKTPETFLSVAEDMVREQLRAPKSAQFASWRDPAVKYSGVTDPKTKECIWTVKSYVDSQNGFGAMIRTNFVAEIRLRRDERMTMQLTDFMSY
jgi:hypothetical protein